MKRSFFLRVTFETPSRQLRDTFGINLNTVLIDPCLHTITFDEALPERFNCPFYYQPHPLCVKAAEEVQRLIVESGKWKEEVDKGKMFGVLIVRTPHSSVHTPHYVAAYSGQISGRSDWEGFVPAVFDYLQPDGYFKREEHEIDNINVRVREMEQSSELKDLRKELREAENRGMELLKGYRKTIEESKAHRDHLRREGRGDEEEMIRESQFQKAELKRIKARVNEELRPLREAVKAAEAEITALKQERKRRSDALQQWLFEHFVMLNARGERKNLIDIFTAHSSPFTPHSSLPVPSGAGECCAPKLLQYAFEHGYTPVTMAEFWWGESPKGEIRRHGDFYPACQGKCRPILDFMLQGIDVEPNPLEQQETIKNLEIIYEDDYLVAVNKPAGMLSVPGRGVRLSAQYFLEHRDTETQSFFKEDKAQQKNKTSVSPCLCVPIHRLDMQTSGVLLFAKTEEIQKIMRSMFERREVSKTYVALLESVLPEGTPKEGVISLPLAADYINRPRQKVDYENGKAAETIYIIKGIRDGHTLLELHPKTGRTHQLRVHCAHKDGLGMPILGDDLYGHHGRRLCLHAQQIEFIHPITHKQIKIFANNLDF